MTIHKEGTASILLVLFTCAVIAITAQIFLPLYSIWWFLSYALALFLLVIILQFFRKPNRTIAVQDNVVLCPADGKVVAIEEVTDDEYFQGKRLQVSIFMSPLNVHINWFPFAGIVKYVRYHPGKYLVAWHPKSSTDNERTTIVVEHASGQEILLRQIAGALARRIVYYPRESQSVGQGDEMGFIKFGSRVDVLLPLNAKVKVDLEQKVKGRQTVIAQLA